MEAWNRVWNLSGKVGDRGCVGDNQPDTLCARMHIPWTHNRVVKVWGGGGGRLLGVSGGEERTYVILSIVQIKINKWVMSLPKS